MFIFFSNSTVDFEEGILQTIGFKEFIPYLQAFDESHDTLINQFVEAPEITPEPEGWKSLVMCLEELKMVTRRYSKKQLKWIRNRFLGSDMREVPLVYSLDTSDLSRWKEMVSQPAMETVESFIEERSINLKPMEKMQRLAHGFDEEKTFHCPGIVIKKKSSSFILILYYIFQQSVIGSLSENFSGAFIKNQTSINVLWLARRSQKSLRKLKRKTKNKTRQFNI